MHPVIYKQTGSLSVDRDSLSSVHTASFLFFLTNTKLSTTFTRSRRLFKVRHISLLRYKRERCALNIYSWFNMKRNSLSGTGIRDSQVRFKFQTATWFAGGTLHSFRWKLRNKNDNQVLHSRVSLHVPCRGECHFAY